MSSIFLIRLVTRWVTNDEWESIICLLLNEIGDCINECLFCNVE